MPRHETAVYRVFRATFKGWDTLCVQAAAFATSLGKERLITISHSADHSDKMITVWFWGDPSEQEG